MLQARVVHHDPTAAPATPLRVGRPVAVVALAGVLVAAAAPALADAAPPDATATASYGESEVWLQPKADDGRQRELVFQESREASPRVLDVRVPRRNRGFVAPWAENLALGLDASGTLTVVMQSNRGLYWTHVEGRPRLRRVPGTTTRDTFPSLFRGRLAYGRSVGDERSTVRVGTLTSARARTVWSNRSDGDWVAQDIAIGAGGAVAFVSVRDGAGNGAYQVRLVRPGRSVKRLLLLQLGHTHEGFLAIRGVSPGGRRLTITRQLDESGTTIKFSLPAGHRVS